MEQEVEAHDAAIFIGGENEVGRASQLKIGFATVDLGKGNESGIYLDVSEGFYLSKKEKDEGMSFSENYIAISMDNAILLRDSLSAMIRSIKRCQDGA